MRAAVSMRTELGRLQWIERSLWYSIRFSTELKMGLLLLHCSFKNIPNENTHNEDDHQDDNPNDDAKCPYKADGKADAPWGEKCCDQTKYNSQDDTDNRPLLQDTLEVLLSGTEEPEGDTDDQDQQFKPHGYSSVSLGNPFLKCQIFSGDFFR